MPRDLGNAHVDGQHPGLHAEGGHRTARTVWTTRVVVGKPNTATPMLTRDDEIHHHQSDLERAAVDRAQRISAGAGAGSDACWRAWASRSVNNRDGSVHIYQPPGEGNALGRIRFNFPNRFLVYQHDTPDKHLFAHDTRAYSHGCMRVQDPAKYAEVLFNIARPTEGWTAERIKKMFGTAEQDIQLQPTPISVHLTYQTAFVDDAGKLQIRRDIYNLDSRTIAAIKSERAVVEPPQERPKEIASSGTRRAMQPSRARCRSSSNCSAAGSSPIRATGRRRPAASRADRATKTLGSRSSRGPTMTRTCNSTIRRRSTANSPHLLKFPCGVNNSGKFSP